MTSSDYLVDVEAGSVLLGRAGWQAVMDALEGDESARDDAFDALQRWAPEPWLAAMEAREEQRS